MNTPFAGPRPFESDLVLDERLNENGLRAYHVGYDQNKFRLEPLVELLESVIPEYALGIHERKAAPNHWIAKIREAAKTVYTTTKYKKRGEFGELVLHLLLRDFCGTVPLVAKIFFKDADNATVHGFDAVQVTERGTKKKLWLGESKFYGDGMSGIRDLTKDLKKHLKANYLRREFALISKKIPNDFPDAAKWRRLMHRHNKLDTIFQSVVIPMVCTYTSDTVNAHSDECAEYVAAFEAECRKLADHFHGTRMTTDCEVLLLLLPVHSKDSLCRQLHNRLLSLQGTNGTQK